MNERRKKNIPVAKERRGLPPGLTNPSVTSLSANYTSEEIEFLNAISKYKSQRHRPFPTVCEILLVLKSLGYRKVEQNTFEDLINGTISFKRSATK